jgi:hypothetical protein
VYAISIVRTYLIYYYASLFLFFNTMQICKFEYAFLIGLLTGILFANLDWRVMEGLLPKWIKNNRAEKLENVWVVFTCGLIVLFLISYWDKLTPYSVLFQGYLFVTGYLGVLLYQWINKLPDKLYAVDQHSQEFEQSILSERSKSTCNPWLKAAGELFIATVVAAKMSIFEFMFQKMNSDQKMEALVMGGALGFTAGLVLILYDVAREGIARSNAEGT